MKFSIRSREEDGRERVETHIRLVSKVIELPSIDFSRCRSLDERQMRFKQVPERSSRFVKMMAGREKRESERSARRVLVRPLFRSQGPLLLLSSIPRSTPEIKLLS